mgnify:CR=1 FL=1
MKKRIDFFAILGLILILFIFRPIFALDNDQSAYDLLIKNGKIFEGSLKPAFRADVAIKDCEIVKIASSIKGRAARVIDANGLYVTPGFIDLHTHVEVGMDMPENRACLNFLTQGTTTVIVGQCGYLPWIIYEKPEDQMNRLSKEGIGPNMAMLIGQGGVRRIVVGEDNRKLTPEELEKMKALVKEAMEQGVFGISSGLDYVPGSYAGTDEVVELVKVVAPYGGVYHTHMRKEKENLIAAIKEAIDIAERSGARVHLSHLKAYPKKNWGLSRQACTLIEEARAKGLKITGDQYPYEFAGKGPDKDLIPEKVWFGERPDTIGKEDLLGIYEHLRDDELIALYEKVTPYHPLSEKHKQFLAGLPRKRLVSLVAQSMFSPEYLRMGVVDLFAFRPVEVTNTRQRMDFWRRLQDPEERKKICTGMKKEIDEVGPENIIIEICVEKDLEGKSLKEIAEKRGKSIEDMAIELGLMGTQIVPMQMSGDDIEYFMKKDYIGTGSDGDAPSYGLNGPFGSVHLRSYTTFLHKIKKYALERKVVSVEHVIRSQTSLPAEVMGFTDRGWIKEGYKADINVIDLYNIKIKATVSNPSQYCQGVKYQIINGKLVIDNGKYNGILAGDVLKLKKQGEDILGGELSY